MKNEWWWIVFGGADDFTVFDFISLIAYNEAGYDSSFIPEMAEAGVRFFYGWAQSKNSRTDTYGLLDWFARFSASASMLINAKTPTFPKLQTASISEGLYGFNYIGNKFREPGNWSSGWAENRPYGWGNRSIWTDNAKMMFARNPNSMFVTIGGPNPFYILSECAWNNWERFNTQLPCPSVQGE
jgi:hypothetical protein